MPQIIIDDEPPESPVKAAIESWVESGEDDLYLTSLSLTTVPSCLATVAVDRRLTALYLDYNDISDVNVVMHCVHLHVLSVVGNNLTHLPASIHQLEHLKSLFVNENQLEELPDDLCQLSRLQEVNVVGNQLTCLPSNIGHLASLESLYLDENHLSHLPDSLCDLRNLNTLECEKNQLASLPERFGNLTSLQVINLSYNHLEKLPKSFSDLPNVIDLALSFNNIKSLPSKFSSHHHIERFFIEGNHLSTLPNWVDDMPQCKVIDAKDNQLKGHCIRPSLSSCSSKLKKLDLGGNFLETLPENIGELTKLERLHLGSTIHEIDRKDFINGNWITDLPESFCKLTQLKYVRLDENQFIKLPPDFGNLVNMIMIFSSLDENQFIKLPADFGNLVNMTYLDLGQNRLLDIPDSFCQLRSLQECTLSKNHLKRLPDRIGDLKNMIAFHIDHNNLEDLPESMGDMDSLKTLDLFHNLLTSFPPCLRRLKSLKRLDLDKNRFDLHYLDYPQVITKSMYAPRDPKLKDNWRGKLRVDKETLDVQRVEETEPRDDYHPDDDIQHNDRWVPTGGSFNYNLLKKAVRQNMSLWKSHGSTHRRRPRYIREGNSWVMVEDEQQDLPDVSPDVISVAAKPQSPPHILPVDDMWEPPIDQAYLSSNHAADADYVAEIRALDDLVTTEEDWGAEAIEVTPPPIPIVTKAYDEHTDIMTSKHAYIPDDQHAEDVMFEKPHFDTEEGQFDDLDDL